ncbi:caspase, EACC1-associated type [Actinokineospora cianjurensis]|uniref:Caspase domain-containing protein n=1 Tax=Actinokineospora cianjurensis TaxID=585224 RepID=A0A421B3S5_9PSEU|nr:AAA domain-containing protein [Actinokineospora cianjurensis]RLK58940.1 caspase domain-containing protein [Actinokineospora cianjurensis]
MTRLTKRALLIGTENYAEQRFGSLPCTRADTELFAQVLRHPSIGAFDLVEVLQDADANTVRGTIADFLAASLHDEQVVLYLSGHGTSSAAADGRFFFLAADTTAERFEDTAVSADFVNERLEQCAAAQKIAVLDCCQSGGFTRGFATSKKPRKEVVDAGPLLRSRGVYVLSSSSADEASFGGGVDQDGSPAPSLFTGEIVRALLTGVADRDGDGRIGVDELFQHVSEQVRRQQAGQTPEKSSLGVNDEIIVANAWRGSALRLDPVTPASRQPPALPTEVAQGAVPGGDPWQDLLEYYHGCLRSDEARPELMFAGQAGDAFVCVGGHERILSGDLGPSGQCEVPPGAEHLVDLVLEEDAELWYGYPAVAFLSDVNRKANRNTRIAPMFVRRVAVVRTPGGVVLEPFGPVEPHRAFASTFLSEEEAAEFMDTYTPSWHTGSHSQLVKDVNHHLRELFGMRDVQRLDPSAMAADLDLSTPVSGARNTALLFTTTREVRATDGLLKDLAYIDGKRGTIAETALGALLPHTRRDARAREWQPVTPLQANEAQHRVIAAAMTNVLTVATGPPGTGKSQLVGNLVATAVANGQTVLVASTNNQAVDEVADRCNRIVPGSVVRTGSKDKRQVEADTLAVLMGSPPPAVNSTTAQVRARLAIEHQAAVTAEFEAKARAEAELLESSGTRSRARSRWKQAGGPDQLPDEREWAAWEARSRKVVTAWFFGRRRRRALLRGLGWLEGDAPQTCALVADRFAAERAWRTLHRRAESLPTDAELDTRAADADRQVRDAAAERLRVAVAEGGRSGIRSVNELLQADGRDWNEVRRVLPHVRGWAVTSLSARRFPTAAALFDLVIIDEASQCLVPHSLPLLFRARRALIIGDPMQLPPVRKLGHEDERRIRSRIGVSAAWLEGLRATYHRHSTFHAFEAAAGRSFLLDEHFRCHPEIIALPNQRFYGGELTVLTDVHAQRGAALPAVSWVDVPGAAVRPPGGSWRNDAEVDEVAQRVDQLIGLLPTDATIGVVTPFAGQKDLLARKFAGVERVRVGTVHTFQGGECDAIVFSLVVSATMPGSTIGWVQRQTYLWNVAITRARAHLVVVGDRDLWASLGGVGAALVAAAGAPPEPTPDGSADDLLPRLYEALSALGTGSVSLNTHLDGYVADGVLDTGTRKLAVRLDLAADDEQARHLRLALAKTKLLASPAENRSATRVPAWRLYDDAPVNTWLR